MNSEAPVLNTAEYTKATRTIFGVNPWSRRFTRPGEVMSSSMSDAMNLTRGPRVLYVSYPSQLLSEGERHQAPVPDNGEAWGEGAWFVADEEHAKKILNNELFSSAGTGHPGDFYGSFPWPAPTALFATRMMVNLHGAEHKEKRSVVGGILTPNGIKKLIKSIKRHATGAVESMRNDQSDLMDIVGRVTSNTICDLMGIPEDNDTPLINDGVLMTRDSVRQSIDTIAKQPGTEDATLAMLGLAELAGQVAEYYTTNPYDAGDLLRPLINPPRSEDTPFGPVQPMSKEDLEQYFMLLLIAGTETSRSASILGMQKILEQTRTDQKFKSDVLFALTSEGEVAQKYQKALVDQTLGYATPVRSVRRVAQTDTIIDGVQYEKGDTIIISYAAINAQRPDGESADEINLESNFDPFVFGWGPHRCIGAHLAKQEILEIFKALLPDLIRDKATIDVTHGDSTFINSPIEASIDRTMSASLRNRVTDAAKGISGLLRKRDF